MRPFPPSPTTRARISLRFCSALASFTDASFLQVVLRQLVFDDLSGWRPRQGLERNDDLRPLVSHKVGCAMFAERREIERRGASDCGFNDLGARAVLTGVDLDVCHTGKVADHTFHFAGN